MPRGGYRPGAGRPKGTTKKLAKAPPLAPEIRKAARASGLSPLEYMLAVMNDASTDNVRRDRMAIAAAPYVHAKPSDAPVGKKEAAAAAAQTAGEGSEWGDDLHAPLN